MSKRNAQVLIANVKSKQPDWAAAYKRLLPGALVSVLTTTKIYARTACALEDAGFQVYDMVFWYAVNESDVLETRPIIMARVKAKGSIIRALIDHSAGAMNIDACRLPGVKDVPRSARKAMNGKAFLGNSLSKGTEDTSGFDPNIGRWPANVMHDGSIKVHRAFAKFGYTKDGIAVQRNGGGQKIGSGTIYSGSKKNVRRADVGYGGEGTAARYFMACKSERSLIRYLTRLTSRKDQRILAFNVAKTVGKMRPKVIKLGTVT